jgi:hypothetical protein
MPFLVRRRTWVDTLQTKRVVRYPLDYRQKIQEKGTIMTTQKKLVRGKLRLLELAGYFNNDGESRSPNKPSG